MVECVPKERLPALMSGLPINCLAYRQWRDDESLAPIRYATVASCTARVRPREQWNSLGREIHHAAEIERHAAIASGVLQHLGLAEFVVHHVVPNALWFKGIDQGHAGRIGEAADYLRHRGVAVSFAAWQGAFIVRDEMNDFLRHFLDYPFLLRYYDLWVFATRSPLAMVINHHLCIGYGSTDQRLIESVRSALAAEGILEFPDRSS